ncbi:MAG: MerR family transcriptional regulator [Bacteroidales bacterium]|nr:MerR family transcriptional regulator [Bacteroidales bacterium]
MEVTKLYYTIGEVAQSLGENTSAIRFWSEQFSDIIKPARNKKGNRLFTPADVENMKTIHYLIKTQGLTIEGAKARMKQNPEGANNRVEIIERLTAIKNQLMDIKAGIEKN